MRKPRRSPVLSDAERQANVEAVNARRGEAEGVIRRANERYDPWDDFRYRSIPKGLKHLQLWTAIQASRQPRTPIPLISIAGNAFSYSVPAPMLASLSLVDRLAGAGIISGSDLDLERHRDRILRDSQMEEAIASSQIEGAVTTRDKAKHMLATGRAPRDRSEQMIVNGYRTMQFLRDRKDERLSIDLLNDIQRLITQDALDDPAGAGRFRSSDDVRIVHPVTGDTIFQPPPARELQRRVQRLIDFANENEPPDRFIPPLIKAAIIHFWLAYEHPYVDGNGRTARALSYWFMLRNGYWLFEFLTISRCIHAAQLQYYRSFRLIEADDGDLNYFTSYLVKMTLRAIDELRERIAALRTSQERIAELAVATGLNERQRDVIDRACRAPHQIFTIESHRHTHVISYEAARLDLQELVNRGLLRETGRLRPREFLAAKDLRAVVGRPK